MKKTLGSIFLTACLLTSSIYANDNILNNDSLINELENLSFEKDYLNLDGYLFDENNLVMIIKYSREDDVQILMEDNEEKPQLIIDYMESSVMEAVCDNETIRDIVENDNVNVEAEFILSNGEKYMVRSLETCS